MGKITAPPPDPPPTRPKKQTTMRFPSHIIELLDKQAKRRGISRTAYVMIAISKAVEEGV